MSYIVERNKKIEKLENILKRKIPNKNAWSYREYADRLQKECEWLPYQIFRVYISPIWILTKSVLASGVSGITGRRMIYYIDNTFDIDLIQMTGINNIYPVKDCIVMVQADDVEIALEGLRLRALDAIRHMKASRFNWGEIDKTNEIHNLFELLNYRIDTSNVSELHRKGRLASKLYKQIQSGIAKEALKMLASLYGEVITECSLNGEKLVVLRRDAWVALGGKYANEIRNLKYMGNLMLGIEENRYKHICNEVNRLVEEYIKLVV